MHDDIIPAAAVARLLCVPKLMPPMTTPLSTKSFLSSQALRVYELPLVFFFLELLSLGLFSLSSMNPALLSCVFYCSFTGFFS